MKAYKRILIGRGQISGTYADSFHCLNYQGEVIGTTGKVREPFEGELDQIRSDLKRHLASVRRELRALRRAEKLLEGKR